jgi:CMP/dCMP kinase
VVVTVSGLPGSGTTTLSRLVARQLGLEHVHAGELFRQMAAESGMSLSDFGRYAENHPDVDVDLDERMASRVRRGDCLLEARLAAWTAVNTGVPAHKVWVRAHASTRASRVARREGIPYPTARAQNREREASERLRYLDVYGIDLDDLSVYDLVVDSGAHGPEVLADQVVGHARSG